MTLPKGNTELSRDPRTIDQIYWANDEGCSVGQQGCTRIEAYDESGHMAYIPWLAVFHGDHLQMRVPADQVTIAYIKTKEAG